MLFGIRQADLLRMAGEGCALADLVRDQLVPVVHASSSEKPVENTLLAWNLVARG